MSVIVPLGGKHRSVKSLLAELMNDEDITKLVIVTMDKEGNTGKAHFEMTRAELTYAAQLINRIAFDEL